MCMTFHTYMLYYQDTSYYFREAMHGSVSKQPPPRMSQNLVEVDELVAGYFNQSVSLDKQTYYARGGHIVVTHYDSFSNTKET